MILHGYLIFFFHFALSREKVVVNATAPVDIKDSRAIVIILRLSGIIRAEIDIVVIWYYFALVFLDSDLLARDLDVLDTSLVPYNSSMILLCLFLALFV